MSYYEHSWRDQPPKRYLYYDHPKDYQAPRHYRNERLIMIKKTIFMSTGEIGGATRTNKSLISTTKRKLQLSIRPTTPINMKMMRTTFNFSKRYTNGKSYNPYPFRAYSPKSYHRNTKNSLPRQDSTTIRNPHYVSYSQHTPPPKKKSHMFD